MSHWGRLSGVLLPLFSLRSKTDYGVGDYGAIEQILPFLKASQQRMLMLLPLLPTTPGDSSPYATQSAFGLNPIYLDLSQIPDVPKLSNTQRQAWNAVRESVNVDYPEVFALKNSLLEAAFAQFSNRQLSEAEARDLREFREAHREWLPNFTLFSALSESFGFRAFWEWPAELAQRKPSALEEANLRLEKRVKYFEWLQFHAHQQWTAVRRAAEKAGILLCGDEPFIIGENSADVWANSHLLRRDARLGVPPDEFSADGQDWGLPFFDFEALAKEDNVWLKRRAKAAASYYDIRRIDHAIGYFRQYVRDATTPRGRFMPQDENAQRELGHRNFRLLSADAPIIAEDLGVIPDFARHVLNELNIPGYKVMRWARRDGVYENPQHYAKNSFVTVGTHDTETLAFWWKYGAPWEREAMTRTFSELHGVDIHAGFSDETHQRLLKAAFASQSDYCVTLWQDIFKEETRVNTPGQVSNDNWAYRMRISSEDLLADSGAQAAVQLLKKLTVETGRDAKEPEVK